MSTLPSPYERRKTLPLYWFNKSSDLRSAAAAVWAARIEPPSASREGYLGAGLGMKVADPAVFYMLCGMSLETLYKAIAVAQQRQFSFDHQLAKLARAAGVPVSEKDEGLLHILEHAIIWDGRYPLPRDRKKKKSRDIYDELDALADKNLYDREDVGSLNIMRPNGALHWEGFDRMWNGASEIYWKCHRDR